MIENESSDNPLESSVLVLNRLFMPVRVINSKRAIILLYKDKAEVITVAEEETYLNYSFDSWIEKSNNGGIESIKKVEYVRTPTLRIAVPRVIRLHRYSGFQDGKVRFTRRNIFARDQYTCQYCEESKPVRQLSIDHVIPKSRGGDTKWTNVVTACKDCNVRKGGRLLKNTDMELNKKPTTPTSNPVVQKRAKQDKYEVWNVFLDNASSVVKIS